MNQCVICGTGIPVRSGRGRQPKTCGEACRAEQTKRAAEESRASFKTCSVDGCGRLANRTGFGLCETHYYRKRRNGHLDLLPLGIDGDLTHTHGYVLVRAKDHPMSHGLSRAYAHRVVYYDAYGDGPFNCKWCDKLVTWDNLHIDHLNDDKKDNRVENLAATCSVCNMQRGSEKKMQTLRDRVGVEFNGEKLTFNEWAKRIGITGFALKARLKKGWPLERALTEPRGKFGPVRK